MQASGVAVSVLCPGPTETNFSAVARGHRARELKAPKMSAAAVAIASHRAFRRNQCICVPGISNKLLMTLPRILPRAAVRQLVGKFNKLK